MSSSQGKWTLWRVDGTVIAVQLEVQLYNYLLSLSIYVHPLSIYQFAIRQLIILSASLAGTRKLSLLLVFASW